MKAVPFSEQKTGSRQQYALSTESGSIVHIDDVRRGKSCDCTCLGCDEPLIANQGEKKIHYFSHAPDASGVATRPCKNPEQIFETLTHEMAKDWISEIKELSLPPYYHKKETDDDGCSYEPVEVISEKTVSFDKVLVERRINDSTYRPDCIGYIGDRPLIIEVYVKHKVEEAKIAKIKNDHLPAVEIVLTHHVTDTCWESIDKAMRTSVNLRWLNCPHGESEHKRHHSAAIFQQQRELFDQRLEEERLERKKKAREKRVKALAETKYQQALSSIELISNKETDQFLNSRSHRIYDLVNQLDNIASELDNMLLFARRKDNCINEYLIPDSIKDVLKTVVEKSMADYEVFALKSIKDSNLKQISNKNFTKMADDEVEPLSSCVWDDPNTQ